MYVHVHVHVISQSKPSVLGTALKKDTTGTKESVLIREVSSFQGGKRMVCVNLGPCRCVLIREVCPHLRGVLLYSLNVNI